MTFITTIHRGKRAIHATKVFVLALQLNEPLGHRLHEQTHNCCRGQHAMTKG